MPAPCIAQKTAEHVPQAVRKAGGAWEIPSEAGSEQRCDDGNKCNLPELQSIIAPESEFAPTACQVKEAQPLTLATAPLQNAMAEPSERNTAAASLPSISSKKEKKSSFWRPFSALATSVCDAYHARQWHLHKKDYEEPIPGMQFSTAPVWSDRKMRQLDSQQDPDKALELQERILEAEAQAEYEEAAAKFLEEQRALETRQLAQGIEDHWLARRLQNEESSPSGRGSIQSRGDSFKEFRRPYKTNKVHFCKHTASCNSRHDSHAPV